MKIVTIVKNINLHLAGEMLRYHELEPFLDRTIDDLNSELSSCYPSFSDFVVDEAVKADGNYNFFPDHFIRSVVIVGAAYYYYISDEEGEAAANTFGGMYREGLYKMLRDHLVNVPDEFISNDHGYAEFEWNLTGGVGIKISDICGD